MSGFGALIFFGQTVEPPASPEKTQALASSWGGIPFCCRRVTKATNRAQGGVGTWFLVVLVRNGGMEEWLHQSDVIKPLTESSYCMPSFPTCYDSWRGFVGRMVFVTGWRP